MQQKAIPGQCTFLDVLRQRAEHRPDGVAFSFLAGGEEGQDAEVTYQRLELHARTVAAALQQLGLAGERALLLYPPGAGYIAGFFGCVYANVVAVPVYPPTPSRTSRLWPRLRRIAQDSGATVALTTRALLPTAREVFDEEPELRGLRLLATDTLGEHEAAHWVEPKASPEELLFLQYTSGSTGQPKGVALSHANLLANSEMIRRKFGHTPEDRGVIWLPPYHDMGLIGGILQPIYAGFPVFLLSPVTFVRRPLRWLEAISRHRGTISGGPNFAFEACVRSIPPAQRETLDLRSWRVAFTGAEPIRADTLERFAEAFAVSGFSRSAFRPVYGLAEATLMVTSNEGSAPPTFQPVSAEALAQHQVRPVEPGAAGARVLVGCGGAAAERVVIAGGEPAAPLPEGQVGEIWIRDASVARGYWKRPEDTEHVFGARLAGDDARYLRTGDLGALLGGELFVTGRIKELIILRGRNLYPQDIERDAEASHPALKPGRSAAFSVDEGGEEKLVLVAELEPRQKAAPEEVAGAIRRALAEAHGAAVEDVVFIRSGSLPTTSSGKIRRGAARERYLRGELEQVSSVRASRAREHEAPRTPAQQRLAEIWARVLEHERVGLHDNFFELGGDSVRGVQVSSLAAEAGLEFTTRELFEHPTVAALCAVARGVADVDAGCGPLALLPWQRALLALPPDAPARLPRRWVLELPPEAEASTVERVLLALWRTHEALRLQLEPRDGGGVEAVLAGPELPLPLESREPSELAAALETVRGTRFLFFPPGGGHRARLLLSVEPLALDAASDALLLRDLGLAWEQAVARPRERPLLPASPAFRRWAERLSQRAGEPGLLARAREYGWEGGAPGEPRTLELGDGGPRRFTRELDEADTRALSHELPRAFGGSLEPALLAALGHALGEVLEPRGAVLVELERDGRTVLEGLEASRTLGSFHAPFPAWLELSRPDSPRALFERTRALLSRAPLGGLAWQWLPSREPARPQAALRVRSEEAHAPGAFTLLSRPEPPPEQALPVRLTCRPAGARLRMEWELSSANAPRAEVLAEAFVGALRSLLAEARAAGARAPAPEDFPLARVNSQQLAQVLSKLRGRGNKDTP